MSFKYEVIEPKLFAGAAADEVLASVVEVLADKQRCSISLAGGSTPVSVYRALSVPPRVQDIEWDRLDLFFGDERWVPHSDSHSNMRMVNENLLSKLSGSKPKTYPFNTELESPQASAKDYQSILQSKLEANNGTAAIDIMLLGMGDDGHMASVFPGSRLLDSDLKSQDLAAVEDWPNQPGSFRVTMTPRMLLGAKKIIFLVQGPGKSEMIAKAFNERAAERFPVHIFHQVSDKVTWLLDSEAAKLL